MMNKKSFVGSMVVMVALMSVVPAPRAFADPSQDLQAGAEQLRSLQGKVVEAERLVEARADAVKAKKEIMRQRERLIRKIEKDQRLQDRITDRDLGMSTAASDAFKVTSGDRAERIKKLESELLNDEKELAVREVELQQAQEAAKESKSAARDSEKELRALAKEIHDENCGKRKFFKRIGKGLSDLGALIADVDNSKSERQEHEIQRILKSAECSQRERVSTRQMPVEREVNIPGSDQVTEDPSNSGKGV
jgi:hypothetical protein